MIPHADREYPITTNLVAEGGQLYACKLCGMTYLTKIQVDESTWEYPCVCGDTYTVTVTKISD